MDAETAAVAEDVGADIARFAKCAMCGYARASRVLRATRRPSCPVRWTGRFNNGDWIAWPRCFSGAHFITARVMPAAEFTHGVH